jgi:hypothetical protein
MNIDALALWFFSAFGLSSVFTFDLDLRLGYIAEGQAALLDCSLLSNTSLEDGNYKTSYAHYIKLHKIYMFHLWR